MLCSLSSRGGICWWLCVCVGLSNESVAAPNYLIFQIASSVYSYTALFLMTLIFLGRIELLASNLDLQLELSLPFQIFHKIHSLIIFI